MAKFSVEVNFDQLASEMIMVKGEKGDTGNTGATGPANTLAIGTVAKGDNAEATITGTSPNQTLNLVLPKGDKGDTGATGAGIPSGGTVGQVVAKTADSTAWIDVYTKSEVDSKDSTEKTRAMAAESALATSITNITPLANAGSHNLYRGKYLGTAVTDAQYTAISNGTFADLCVGDYWTIGGINWVIAGFDYYANCGDNAVLGHHAVIVPATRLYTAKMNETNDTTGAYVGSEMYTTNLAQAKTTISGIFGTHLKSHRIYLQNAMSNGYPSGGMWADSTVDLMTEVMVYGCKHFAAMANGSVLPTNYAVENSQLPLFAQNAAMIKIRQDYWLRDAVSANFFAVVYDNGGCNCDDAHDSIGVRPAFCIS